MLHCWGPQPTCAIRRGRKTELARRVLYLSQWFWPEPNRRGLELIHGLQAAGFHVEALTGFPNYPTGKLAPGYRLSLYRREEVEGVVVHRVVLHPSHDRSSLGRTLNYLSFSLSALVFCLLQSHRYDLIYVYHPPITSGLAAALAGLLWHRPFVLEIQDLWPDSVAASGMTATGFLARLLDPMCRFVYQRAALVLGQSEGMAALLVQRGVALERTDVFYNWADSTAAQANGVHDLASLNFEGRFNFVYAGNLGAVQALEVLIKAAHSLEETDPHIQLTLIGNGTHRARLEALVQELGAANVQILPGVPSTHIGDVLEAAQVQVVHLKNDPLFEITIPSKVQLCLAMGRPILIGVGGEAARIVTDAGAGIAVPPQNVGAMAKAMQKMASLPQAELDAMGTCGRSAYESRFAFRPTMDRLAAHLRRIMKAPATTQDEDLISCESRSTDAAPGCGLDGDVKKHTI